MAVILPLGALAAAAPERATRPRVRLVLTRRGRTLITGAAFLLGILIALMCFMFLGGAFAGASEHGDVVTVESGDTLWAYAEAYAPEGVDHQRFIEDVRRLNGLATPRLTAGQEILLPQDARTGK